MGTNRLAARNIVEAITLTTDNTYELLRILRRNLPLIQEVDTEEGEIACIAQACFDVFEKEGDVLLSSEARDQLVKATVGPLMQGIVELCNYPPEVRGQLLDAAIIEAECRLEWEQSLRPMQAGIHQAIENLGPHDRALLTVLTQLWDTDVAEGTDFLNAAAAIVRDAPVDALRGDPSVERLLRIYDRTKAYPAA